MKVKIYADKDDFDNPKDYDKYKENLKGWRRGHKKRNPWKTKN